MLKYVYYDGSHLESYEVDGAPHALMEDILETILPGSWKDYQQVINSGGDMIEDLQIKIVDDNCLIPVDYISNWLYTFSLRKMGKSLQERFRMYRRDLENSYKVAWALEPSHNLVIRKWDTGIDDGYEPINFSLWDLSNVFSNFGIPEEVLEGCDREGRIYGPLHYIQLVAGSTECGPRGSLLANQIEYIENLPEGEYIIAVISDMLIGNGIPDPGDHLDDFLDDLNVSISLKATAFVGEWDAK